MWIYRAYCITPLITHKEDGYLLISVGDIAVYAGFGWFSIISNVNRPAKPQPTIEQTGRLVPTI